MALPTDVIFFLKANSAICGPDHDVILPRGSVKGAWEIELGVVIGQKASYVSEEEAMDHVAGYCTVHDVSEREYRSAERRVGTECVSPCRSRSSSHHYITTKYPPHIIIYI